jgi:hypothetical protein
MLGFTEQKRKRSPKYVCQTDRYRHRDKDREKRKRERRKKGKRRSRLLKT